MKTFVKAQAKDANGTSFVGYLQASYQGLCDHLGLPNDRTRDDEWRSSDNKTKAEWAFKSVGDKKTVITIYDYKDPRPTEYIDLWHIGLKGSKTELERFFREQRLFVAVGKK